jgi:hypothetical protein
MQTDDRKRTGYPPFSHTPPTSVPPPSLSHGTYPFLSATSLPTQLHVASSAPLPFSKTLISNDGMRASVPVIASARTIAGNACVRSQAALTRTRVDALSRGRVGPSPRARGRRESARGGRRAGGRESNRVGARAREARAPSRSHLCVTISPYLTPKVNVRGGAACARKRNPPAMARPVRAGPRPRRRLPHQ